MLQSEVVIVAVLELAYYDVRLSKSRQYQSTRHTLNNT